MKEIISPVLAVVLLLASAFTLTNELNWDIGTGYAVKFSGKYADGVFKTLKGIIVFDEQNPAGAKFDITIDVASINTGNGMKNRHAKSDKWFDAEKYPVIRFVSSSVMKKGTGYEAKGELEMHGVKKNFTIPFIFTQNGSMGIFNGSFKVNQTDFGIGEAKGNGADFTNLQVSVPVTSKQL